MKRFGPVWHGWQFFLACLPALTIAVVCNYFKEQILRDRLAASTSAETSASATCATAAGMQMAPPASASPQFNATKASSAPSQHAEDEGAIAGAGKGALDGATPQLMQQRIRELEDRLRKVEDARAIGLDQVRLSLPLSGLMEGVSGDFQLPVPGLLGASTPAPQRSAAVTCEEASASSRSLPPAAAVSGPWWGRLVSRFKGMKSLGSGSGGDDKYAE